MATEEGGNQLQTWQDALLVFIQSRVDSQEQTGIADLVQELAEAGHKKTGNIQNFLSDSKKAKGSEEHRKLWEQCKKNRDEVLASAASGEKAAQQ
jgi:hypothetical protein